jgi:uncharacterized membrane protein
MLITGFIFVVSFSTLYVQTHIVGGTACSCTLPIPVLIPTLSSLGILIGSFVYYMMAPKLMESDKNLAENSRILIGMLRSDERKIIDKLVKNKGEILQSKLSSEFGKVKAFRTLRSLISRGIVTKESHGKTNKIKLNDEFKEVLCY